MKDTALRPGITRSSRGSSAGQPGREKSTTRIATQGGDMTWTHKTSECAVTSSGYSFHQAVYPEGVDVVASRRGAVRST